MLLVCEIRGPHESPGTLIAKVPWMLSLQACSVNAEKCAQLVKKTTKALESSTRINENGSGPDPQLQSRLSCLCRHSIRWSDSVCHRGILVPHKKRLGGLR